MYVVVDLPPNMMPLPSMELHIQVWAPRLPNTHTRASGGNMALCQWICALHIRV